MYEELRFIWIRSEPPKVVQRKLNLTSVFVVRQRRIEGYVTRLAERLDTI